jgi:hypothetical protein
MLPVRNPGKQASQRAGLTPATGVAGDAAGPAALRPGEVTSPSPAGPPPGPAEPPSPPGPSSPPGARARLLTPAALIITVFALVALGLRLYQLARPGFLLSVTEYDDGPYFGSAVRLVNGSIPYRDFLLVQPPGITLLMTPAALLGKAAGSTDWAIAIGRLMTVAASVACVVLAGLLTRHRGAIAVVVACGLTAVYPDSIQAAHTVLVEPWLAMFCLAGALAIFDGDRFTTSTRRLAWGGVAFGFAGAVEVWAIFPLVIIAAAMLRQPRQVISCLAGAAAGFLVPVLPFAAASPKGFYDGLVTAQVGSRVNAARVPSWYRMKEMTGLSGIHIAHSTAWLAALAIALLVLVLTGLAWAVTRQLPTLLEWFAQGSAVLIVAAFMWPIQFHYHFVAFLAPFVGLGIGLPAARLLRGIAAGRRARPAAGPGRDALAARWPEWGAVAVAVIVLAGFTASQARAISRLEPHVQYSTITRVRQLIPPGACVVTDQASLTITANRFVSGQPGCPLLVDSIGTDYALSHGRNPLTGAARFPALVAVWRNALARAQYVWLSGREAHRVPWTPALMAYLSQHFTQIKGHGVEGGVFRRDGLPGPR